MGFDQNARKEAQIGGEETYYLWFLDWLLGATYGGSTDSASFCVTFDSFSPPPPPLFFLFSAIKPLHHVIIVVCSLTH
jgi:hypothetical protein